MSLAAPVDISASPSRKHPNNTYAIAETPPCVAESRGWAWCLFWTTCLAAPIPLLIPYLTRLWQQEHYQFFPLAAASVVLLVLARWDGRFRAPRSWWGSGFLLGGWVATALSVAIFSPWLAMVGFVALASSWLLSAREGSGRSLLVLVLPLLTLIRLPLQTDMLLIVRLQTWTTKIASLLLDVLMIPHLTTGNVIELTGRELFVAEACSGIQSVFTLFFLASLLVAYNRHPLWFTPLYWAAAVLVAIIGNAIRVASVAVADSIFGFDWATGWSHEVVGYVALSIAVLLLLSFDQWITAFLHPIQDVPNYLGLESNPLVDCWNACMGIVPGENEFPAATTAMQSAVAPRRPRFGWVLPVAMTTVCLLLCTLTTLSLGSGWNGSVRQPSEQELTVFFTPPEDMFAGVWNDGSVVNHEIARDGEDRRLGKAADIWSVADSELQYQVVLSQPYIGWHELCICYENLEWELADRSIITSDQNAADNLAERGNPQFAFARFRRNDDRRGYLLFAAITYDGRGVAPPLGPGLVERLGQRFAVNPYVPQQEMMMAQLWLESEERLHPDDIQRLRETFDRVRLRILETVRNSPE
ncbi:exosortase U [Candidatus Laterigemmans baculatus]|uniref:exosortase U n=1 Tax=Candidatus Laterigemmans baculatus TaxID=2770505 RepID=UPI0013DA61A3|nr:exosortase U [Candidatus Laterigemmans baculatus]